MTSAQVVTFIADAAEAIGWQAGVGGAETAGQIVSFLAAHPERVEPFFAGRETLLDWPDTFWREGRLTWQARDGTVWRPVYKPAA